MKEWNYPELKNIGIEMTKSYDYSGKPCGTRPNPGPTSGDVCLVYTVQNAKPTIIECSWAVKKATGNTHQDAGVWKCQPSGGGY